MGRIMLVATVFAFAMTLGTVQASADTNGSGYCFNWFRDADGDGIPNGLDDDWVRPRDGTGYKLRNDFGKFLSLLMPLSGDENQHQYQQRKNKPETPGDHTRSWLRQRDQSCK